MEKAMGKAGTNKPQTLPTLEEFWAAFVKSQEEFDRRTREADRRMRETDRQIGDLGRKFGSTVEHLVAPNLLKKFNALGFNFTRYGPNIMIADTSKNIAAEVDIFLENGDCAIAVEVKAQLKIDDIKEHVKRMATLRRYADARQDRRKLYGAVAGAIMFENVKEYALKTGFFVISQSGDTMKIDVPEGFKPRAW
ncbi:MAG: hypothetical protein LBP21_06505 [Synergistaceae bacterium]|jgi:hypothetical protein|nr:hypothetical protein [Synergistaceae bacterium]